MLCCGMVCCVMVCWILLGSDALILHAMLYFALL